MACRKGYSTYLQLTFIVGAPSSMRTITKDKIWQGLWGKVVVVKAGKNSYNECNDSGKDGRQVIRMAAVDGARDGKRDKILKVIEDLSLFDDDLMTLVFDKNVLATGLLLNIILQRDDLKVIEAVAQREYKNPMAGGRSITIDIYAVDGDGKVYDVEVQCDPSGADVHRARFHSSMIDSKMLRETQKFKELHDSYVIFITRTDVVGGGLPMYHVERTFRETGEAFNDGSHIIYVNGSYKNEATPVGKLMHDFRCTSSDDMFYTELARQVEYFKETEGGREIMCKAFKELAAELAAELAKELAEEKAKELAEEKAKELAEEKAKELAAEKAEELAEEKAAEKAEELACRLLMRGKMTEEEIAEDTGLSLEAVKGLAKLQPT